MAAVAVGVATAARAKWTPAFAHRPPELTPEDRSYVGRWVAEEVERLRGLSYEELVRYEGHDLHCDGLTPSGAEVMRETSVLWDDRDRRHLRVFVDAVQPQPGWLFSSLAKHDFIRAPDGSFIGE